MLSRNKTNREIQTVIYRLQYIYLNGDEYIIEKHMDLFVEAIKHKITPCPTVYSEPLMHQVGSDK